MVPLTIGQNISVAGFTQGTQEVRKGDRFRLLIPANHAFGPQGNPRFKVPADAWLSYDVEVVTVEAPPPAASPEPASIGPSAPAGDGHNHDHPHPHPAEVAPAKKPN